MRIPRGLSVAVVVVTVLGASAQAWAASGWQLQTTPSPATTNNWLASVTATSSSNAWAVGYYSDSPSTYAGLIEHYNGTWTIQALPNVTGGLVLAGVKATSSSNAWAVGYSSPNATANTTFIDHYDGAAWTQQTSPSPNSNLNELLGVATTSASNAWAVGFRGTTGTGGHTYTLVERYDGTSWNVQTSPSPSSTENRLNGVSANSASDAWAVGYTTNSSGVRRTLIEHWDGTSWTRTSSKNRGTGENELTGVSATSASDAWAVGYSVGSTAIKTLAEHWDGTSWSVVSSPNPSASESVFNAVKATSSSNAWAVGYLVSGPLGEWQTLVERWNGTSWTVQKSPNGGSLSDSLAGVAATSSSNGFAVGQTETDFFFKYTNTLAMHCC